MKFASMFRMSCLAVLGMAAVASATRAEEVKLSYQPDGSQDAKIYLYAGFLWRRPGAP